MAWRFEPGNGLGAEFRRVATEEIDRVRSMLASDEMAREEAVHRSRRAFKKLRALVRLGRPALGDAYAAENRRWRDAGRLLSDARDSAVIAATLERLVDGASWSPSAAELARLRAALNGAPHANGVDLEERITEVLSGLECARAAVLDATWPEGEPELEKGLKRSQVRLRKSWKAARKDPIAERLHEWRKRTKDFMAVAALLRDFLPKSFRAFREDAETLADALGYDHDFFLLQGRMCGTAVSIEADLRARLLARIECCRRDFRAEAFSTGKGLSSIRPEELSARIVKRWAKASRRAAR